MNMEQLTDMFKENSIELNVEACGCCMSPWIKVKYKGEVVWESDSQDIKMIEELNDK